VPTLDSKIVSITTAFKHAKNHEYYNHCVEAVLTSQQSERPRHLERTYDHEQINEIYNITNQRLKARLGQQRGVETAETQRLRRRLKNLSAIQKYLRGNPNASIVDVLGWGKHARGAQSRMGVSESNETRGQSTSGREERPLLGFGLRRQTRVASS
tara:strand:- start:77 stop:544 length:468 start_codon:yes stop_codon:yes gene_type:complete